MSDPRGWEALTQQEAEQDARRREGEAFDAGAEAVRGEIVCSVCGENHDRDESAACDGCDPLRFDEWVEKVRAERDVAVRERDQALRGGLSAHPTDEGGPGHEDEFWLRLKLRAAIRHLRDIEDEFRLRGGLPEGFNQKRADRARQLYEAISDDFLNGKMNRPTVRERAEAAERERDQAQEALREIVRRETVSEYSSIYAAPGEFAWVARIALAKGEPQT